jgi:hypothetical protein
VFLCSLHLFFVLCSGRIVSIVSRSTLFWSLSSVQISWCATQVFCSSSSSVVASTAANQVFVEVCITRSSSST